MEEYYEVIQNVTKEHSVTGEKLLSERLQISRTEGAHIRKRKHFCFLIVISYTWI